MKTHELMKIGQLEPAELQIEERVSQQGEPCWNVSRKILQLAVV